MATASSDDDSDDDIRMIYDAFEPRIADVLSHIDDGMKADIEKELTETFDKHELTDIREKIFTLVKEKAARCLCLPNAGGIFGKRHDFVTHDDLRAAAKQVSQWEAVNRRAEGSLFAVYAKSQEGSSEIVQPIRMWLFHLRPRTRKQG